MRALCAGSRLCRSLAGSGALLDPVVGPDGTPLGDGHSEFQALGALSHGGRGCLRLGPRRARFTVAERSHRFPALRAPAVTSVRVQLPGAGATALAVLPRLGVCLLEPRVRSDGLERGLRDPDLLQLHSEPGDVSHELLERPPHLDLKGIRVRRSGLQGVEPDVVLRPREGLRVASHAPVTGHCPSLSVRVAILITERPLSASREGLGFLPAVLQAGEGSSAEGASSGRLTHPRHLYRVRSRRSSQSWGACVVLSWHFLGSRFLVRDAVPCP